MERRYCTRAIEVRKAEDAVTTLRGYAAVYDSPSDPIMGRFIERLAPGCFDAALASNPDVLCRFEHEGGLMIMGRTSSGTLRIGSDGTGLWYEVDLPNTSAARDLGELVKRGDVSGSSFAFGPPEPDDQVWVRDKGKLPVRTITRIKELIDVAPVSSPAYRATDVSARSLELAEAVPEPSEVALDTEVARLKLELTARDFS